MAAMDTDNRDNEVINGYQEDRIEALVRRIKELEEHARTLQKQLEAAVYGRDLDG